MPATALPPLATRSAPAAFAGGAIIGALGSLIGLGGAEFSDRCGGDVPRKLQGGL